MNTVQLAPLLFGLSAALLWGVGDFFAAKASKKHSPETTAFWVSLVGLAAYCCLFLISHGSEPWTKAGSLYAGGSGIGMELGLYTFYKALTAGPVSITSPLSSAYPLVSTIVILLLFQGSLSGVEVLGIIITVAGVMMAAGFLDSKRTDRKLTAGVTYSLMTILLWGITYALLGQAVASIGWQKSMLIDMIAGAFALCLLLSYIALPQLKLSWRRHYLKDRFIIGAAIMQLTGGVVFSIGLSRSPSSAAIIAISSCYPSITMLLALRHFHERPAILQLIGGVTTAAGIIILTAM